MDRRSFLGLGAVAAGSMLAGCAVPPARSRRCIADDAPIVGGQCRLMPVRVSPEREIRTVVGLRPYRPSGFNVSAERLGDTLVVHNYGHGGGGITLSWGTSELAVEEAWDRGEKRFAVLGCGAVGLASARRAIAAASRCWAPGRSGLQPRGFCRRKASR